MQNNPSNEKTYNETWTYRFDFFKKNGAPGRKMHSEAFSKLPLSKRIKIQFNFLAFFFHFFYYLAKGMWKGAITLLLLTFAIVLIGSLIGLSDGVVNALGYGIAAISGMTANYTYYRKEILKENDFNIFKGFGKIDH